MTHLSWPAFPCPRSRQRLEILLCARPAGLDCLDLPRAFYVRRSCHSANPGAGSPASSITFKGFVGKEPALIYPIESRSDDSIALSVKIHLV